MFHMNDSGSWTLGVKIGLPFTILGLIILLVATVVFFIIALGEDRGSYVVFTNMGVFVTGIIGVILTLLYVGGMLWAYYPYSGEYHQYRTVSGTVDRISNRYIVTNDGRGNSSGGQKFVVTFKGSEQQFGINDTRAALVKPGDKIAINCIRVFEYGSTDGYDCKWGGKR